MKCLLLSLYFPPPFSGGSGVYLHNIFQRFPHGEVTVFSWVPPKVKPSEVPGMRIIRRRYIRMLFSQRSVPGRKLIKSLVLLLWFAELMWLCLRIRPNVIYLGELSLGLMALWLKRLLGIPFITFVYGEELAWTSTPQYLNNLTRQTCQEAEAVVTISRFTVDLLIKAGVPSERIVLAYPGVNTTLFNPNWDTAALRSQLGLIDCKILLTVGRLTKRKGHAQVISAMPKVLQVVPDVRYVIVGIEWENLRPLIEALHLEQHVILTGYVDPEEFPQYYCICDVFVMANYELPDSKDTEGFGIVFLEAGACGKPVIGGRAGGVPDVVVDGETGLLVDATDLDALANALIRLLTDEDYARRLGLNGRRRATAFDWEATTATVRKLGLAVADQV